MSTRRGTSGRKGAVSTAAKLVVLALVAAGLGVIATAAPAAADDPPVHINTWGGSGSGNGLFNTSRGVAVAPNGNVYVVDVGNSRVQYFDKYGAYLGQWGSAGGGHGQFTSAAAIAVGPDGSVFVGDTAGNGRVQKFDSTGTWMAQYTTFSAPFQSLSFPRGIAVDSAGHLFITHRGADSGDIDHMIELDATGTPVTEVFPGQGGHFRNGVAVAVGPDDSIYIGDSGNRRVYHYDNDGTYLDEWAGAGGALFGLTAVAFDPNGNLYVSHDAGIEKFTATGTPVLTFAGGGLGLAADGHARIYGSTGDEVRVYGPEVVSVSATADETTVIAGEDIHFHVTVNNVSDEAITNVSVVDDLGTCNPTIASIAAAASTTVDCTYATTQADVGTVSDFATVDTDQTFAEATNTVNVTVSAPLTIVVTADEGAVSPPDTIHAHVQVTNTGNSTLTGINVSFVGAFGCTVPLPDLGIGLSSTLDCNYPTLGSDIGSHAFSATVDTDQTDPVDSNTLFVGVNEPGNAEQPLGFISEFGSAVGVATGTDGTVYATDTANNRILRFDAEGNYLGEWGIGGSGDGEFSGPIGIAVGPYDNVYVVDTGNNRVQKFDSNGSYQSQWGTSGSGDGEFSGPTGIAVDANENVFVVDTGNSRIQRFDLDNNFVTVWSANGNGNNHFDGPRGIAVSTVGTVYVADANNDRVIAFDQDGNYVTHWGGTGSLHTQFDTPVGVAVDSVGNVFVADGANNRVQKFSSDGHFLTGWGSTGSGEGEFNGPDGIAVNGNGEVYVADSGNNRIQRFGYLPRITITKSADEASVSAGQTIHYHLVITNTGNVDLTNISVSDGAASDCEVQAGTFNLSVNDYTTVDCEYTTTGYDAGNYRNVATVSSNEANNVDSNPVDVTVDPVLTVSKSALETSVNAGSNIHYTVGFTNTSALTLTNVVVSDPNAPACNRTIPTVDPGIGVSINCTFLTSAQNVGTYTNVATVSADQTPAVDSDPVDVTVSSASPLAAGDLHNCVLLDGGIVKCWGYNGFGQLGLGNTINRGDSNASGHQMGANLPAVNLGTGRTARAIAAGGNHTCALLDNGSVKCWGNNNFGQLGQGDTINRGDNPGEMGDNLPAVNLGAGRTALAISTGQTHSCALLDDHTVKCWGRNQGGQLGQGDTTARGDNPGEMGDSLPAINLGAGRTAVSVNAAGANVCAVLDNATLKCWGDNVAGQLGQGDVAARGDNGGEMGDSLPAVNVGTGRTVASVSQRGNHTCAVLDDATLKCWGVNAYGQLGLGNTVTRGDNPGEMGDSLPTIINVASPVTVASGAQHTCALLTGGTVKCWGRGTNGQLGQGDAQARGDHAGEMAAIPAINLGTGRTAVGVATGATHTCAILDNNTVKCFGIDSGVNSYGQLGIGVLGDRGNLPNQMGDNLPAISLG